MPSKISALASAISATESKNAMCAASTLVTIATSGRRSRLSARISPGWFMPTSKTP
jgi:hypothetical protein